MTRKRTVGLLVGVLASIAVTAVVKAGYTNSYYVTVVPGSNGYASGALGDARHSGDGFQFIGCHIYRAASGIFDAGCAARNSTGNDFVTCYTVNPDLIQLIGTISQGGHLYFSVSAGACSAIEVSYGSQFRPM
jgi:hypothetical protein